jgi:nucleoid DNA-binding protein
MDRGEFAKQLAAQSQLSEKEAGQFLDAFSNVLTSYFKKGEKVVIAEFGSFYVKDDQSVQFYPSAKLKQLVE